MNNNEKKEYFEGKITKAKNDIEYHKEKLAQARFDLTTFEDLLKSI